MSLVNTAACKPSGSLLAMPIRSSSPSAVMTGTTGPNDSSVASRLSSGTRSATVNS